MPDDPFIHLHLHTEYSALDGSVRIKELMKRAALYDMPAVAMTDHGNIFGAIEFYQKAKSVGIKPIIGCEVYLTPPGVSMRERRSDPILIGGGKKKKKRYSHLTLLAATNEGYANLMKLVSLGHLEGMYHKPRIDKEALNAHSAGLICLSGCLGGEINQSILDEDLVSARRSIGEFRDIFGPERFFLEIQDHRYPEQEVCTKKMVEFSRDFGLNLVAANDVHFLSQADHEAHDVLICIGTNSLLLDENRMKYSPEIYFKSTPEMRQLFRELPQACDNTYRIAQMCDVSIHLDSTSSEKYPQFDSPDGSPREEYFRRVCYEGLAWRYGENRAMSDADLRNRLDYEIEVMLSMGFVSYFLITWDFVKWAKDNGVPVGPGRGSAAGSLVSYVLGITDICPLRFELIFERFLNPERVSPPDIDIDFCPTKRPMVIDYVRRKYGERAVSQIITFGTLGAKSVIRDVARVMGLGYSEGDRIAKMIPKELNITLEGAVNKNPELAAEIDNNPTAAQLWKYSTFLEGLTRGTGIHAAGVVIGDRDLTNYVPLTRGKEGEVVTQYAMSPLTDLGMLKMDFLGLKTLTVIQDAVELIRRHTPEFELDHEKFDDKDTFALIGRGETIALFQLESGGMMTLCRQFEVNRIEDVVALIALYRPGPMDLIPDFIARKTGKKKIQYLHPLLQAVSEETYGILIYQEQVQKAANVLAGYSLGEADLLRRAMGKKKLEEMVKQRAKFVKGCAEVNQIPEKKANDIFDLLEKFAGYGFNKSHSAAYALVCYHTAYLKAHYPVEFMAAMLSNEIDDTKKISILVAECQRMGITIQAPDVNTSMLKFSPEEQDSGKMAVRFGLAAVKNVGAGAMEEVIREREANGRFSSLEDFASRLDSRSVNRKILENLIKAGAFDFTGERRDLLFSRVGQVIAASSSAQRDRASGQGSLFDLNELISAPPVVAMVDEEVVEWSQREYLAYEKELLGFYVTGHPLDEYKSVWESGKFTTLSQLPELRESKKTYRFAGMINDVSVKYTKQEGKPFAILIFEDPTGSVEVKVWSEAYLKFNQLLVSGTVVELRAKADYEERSDQDQLTASEIKPITRPDTKAVAKNSRKKVQSAVIVQLDSSRDSVSSLDTILATTKRHRGDRPLQLRIRTAGGEVVTIEAGKQYSVSDDFTSASEIRRWVM